MILLSEVTAGYRDQNPPTGEKVDTHSLTHLHSQVAEIMKGEERKGRGALCCLMYFALRVSKAYRPRLATGVDATAPHRT